MSFNYNFLVFGTGLAGFCFALKITEFGKVAVIAKNWIAVILVAQFPINNAYASFDVASTGFYESKPLAIIYKETEVLFNKSTLSRKLCELRNLRNVPDLIIKMVQQIKERIGLQYKIEHPKNSNKLK